jgi:hypothetical protein
VVVTCSIVILEPKLGTPTAGPYDLTAIPDADKVPADEWIAYRASKRLAYQAAEVFMTSKQPTFDLVNILRSYVQGRNELVTRKEDVHNGSNDVMVDLVLGAKGGRPRKANTVFVDDVAKVEVLALDPKLAKNGDNFIAAGSPSGKSIEWNDVTQIAGKLFPDTVKVVFCLGGEIRKASQLSYDVSKQRKLSVSSLQD